MANWIAANPRKFLPHESHFYESAEETGLYTIYLACVCMKETPYAIYTLPVCAVSCLLCDVCSLAEH